MTSSTALSKIINVHSSFYIGWASAALLDKKEVRDKYLTSTSVLNDEIAFPLSVIKDMLSDDKKRYSSLGHFIMGILRNVIKESYEITLEFAKVNGLTNRLKTQKWYPFARICRNCLSHNLKIEFRHQRDRSQLPVIWNGITISSSNENQALDINEFTLLKARELLHEFRRFITESNIN